MAVVCDTAVLIAADRRDRRAAALVRAARLNGDTLFVPVSCVAQAWRDGARQASLVQFLAGCREIGMFSGEAREIGSLLAKSGTSDVVDASVVIAAAPGHVIVTGDPDDMAHLVEAAGTRSRVERF